jgi:hypothetical protein
MDHENHKTRTETAYRSFFGLILEVTLRGRLQDKKTKHRLWTMNIKITFLQLNWKTCRQNEDGCLLGCSAV